MTKLPGTQDEDKTTGSSTRRECFFEMMAELGVDKLHGVELLRLVKMTANIYDSILAERMRVENMSAPRWRILVQLFVEARCGEDVLNPTQISEIQRLSKNTVSAHLRSLEDQGLIERKVDPDDLRQFQIRLSAAGERMVQASTPGHMDFLNRLADDLDEQEIETLQQLLSKLYQSLCTHAGDKTCRPD